jgi:serine/threonine-protein phosphatase 2A regulatory subunit B'
MSKAGLLPDSLAGKEIPKSGPISRIKNTPKDNIPVAKTPRRQRSSRFHVSEKVELEKLSNFKGNIHPLYLD